MFRCLNESSSTTLSVQSCPPNWLDRRFYSSLETLPVPGQAAKMGLGGSPDPRSWLLPLHMHPWLGARPAERRLPAPALPVGMSRGRMLRLCFCTSSLSPVPRGEQAAPQSSPSPPGQDSPVCRQVAGRALPLSVLPARRAELGFPKGPGGCQK